MHSQVIYVAGPLTTSGLIWHNVRNAMLAADVLLKKGHTPVIPHLSAIWAMSTEDAANFPESVWLNWGLRLLERCDSLYRIAGLSRGTEGEVAHAQSLGLTIYYNLDDIPEVKQVLA